MTLSHGIYVATKMLKRGFNLKNNLEYLATQNFTQFPGNLPQRIQ